MATSVICSILTFFTWYYPWSELTDFLVKMFTELGNDIMLEKLVILLHCFGKVVNLIPERENQTWTRFATNLMT